MSRQIIGTAVGITRAATVLTNLAVAGSANANLYCVSKNKRDTISENIPGDFTEFETAFQENRTSITLTNDPEYKDPNRVFVHEDFKICVFAVAIPLSNGYHFMLYGLPRSVRKPAINRNNRFQAILQTALRPSRKAWNNNNDFFNRLAMTCSYKCET